MDTLDALEGEDAAIFALFLAWVEQEHIQELEAKEQKEEPEVHDQFLRFLKGNVLGDYLGTETFRNFISNCLLTSVELNERTDLYPY